MAQEVSTCAHSTPHLVTTAPTSIGKLIEKCARTQFLVVVGLLHASPEIGKGRRRHLALLHAICTGGPMVDHKRV